MMQNITPQLLKAKSREFNWDNIKLEKLFNLMKKYFKNLKIEWDKSSGEEWARILDNNKIVGYIRIDFPLMILHSKLRTQLQIEYETIFVNDFDKKVFFLETNEFKNIFHKNIITEAIDLNAFSINDLWYATI